MLNTQAMGEVRRLAQEVSEREGVRLYDLEFVGRGAQRILRVYLDKEGQPVSIDDCANVSRGLSLLLDVEDIIPGQTYELEVSSPGLDRILREPWHFESAVGEKIKVRTNAPMPGAQAGRAPMKQCKGRLLKIENSQLQIAGEKDEWLVPLSIVHKANVIYEFETPTKPKNSKVKR